MTDNAKETTTDLSEKKRREQDLEAHYDLDGASYQEGNVILTGDKTDTNDPSSSKNIRKQSFAEKEKNKMKDQPEKLDKEKNMDFETELKKEK